MGVTLSGVVVAATVVVPATADDVSAAADDVSAAADVVSAAADVVSAAADVVSAAADVVSAAADVVSVVADVVSAAAECCIVTNARVRSASGMVWDEIENEDIVLQDRLSDVEAALPVVQLELLGGTVGFQMYAFRHQLTDAQ
ncbi:unnamed protein product [Closterium sp. Naga37s-1]|nr:unnamed protein product [Closterium sp. Naga37s-1]